VSPSDTVLPSLPCHYQTLRVNPAGSPQFAQLLVHRHRDSSPSEHAVLARRLTCTQSLSRRTFQPDSAVSAHSVSLSDDVLIQEGEHGDNTVRDTASPDRGRTSGPSQSAQPALPDGRAQPSLSLPDALRRTPSGPRRRHSAEGPRPEHRPADGAPREGGQGPHRSGGISESAPVSSVEVSNRLLAEGRTLFSCSPVCRSHLFAVHAA